MSDTTPPPDVPDADWAEQLQDADPQRDEDASDTAAGDLEIGTAEADEADLAEQQVEVFTPDDEAE